MSIQITIGLGDQDVSADTLDRHMAALGFSRGVGQQHAVSAPAAAPAAPAEETKTEEPAPKPRGKARAKDAAPAISANPEDRKPPEDDAETQEQDAADEKAEVEAAREPEKPLTVEDVKAAVGLYVHKHGMPATQEDGVKIFVAALGKPPAGQDFWKMSLLADATQSQLQKTIAEWTAAAGSDKRFEG